MRAFLETSFLCALYRPQINSEEAERRFVRIQEVPLVSSLVLFEFRQSIRLQVFRFNTDRKQGFSQREAASMLAVFDKSIADGLFRVAPIDWSSVHCIAEELSASYTIKKGHRSLDVLHVASALSVKVECFLTFDENQMRLAKSVGLKG